MILNIRGSSCSGKSHLVRQLLAEFPSSEVWEKTGWNKTRGKHVGHLLPGGLFVVGPYSGETRTAGLDVLMPGRTELVTLWLEQNCQQYPFVIFESTAASLTNGRYHEMRQRLDAAMDVHNSITFAFLNTPLGVCQTRLMERGADITNSETQWERVQQIRNRFTTMKETCLTLDWEDSYAQLITLLQTVGGWDPFSTPPIIHPKVKTRRTLQNVWDDIPGYQNDPERMQRLEGERVKHREKFAA